MCHMSHVTCHHFFFFKYKIKIEYKLVELVDGGSVINVAYPV